MPWHGVTPVSLPVNAATEAGYKGINIVTLWVAASLRGYDTGYWASYRQWQELGAQVRKGEQGSTIIFYREIPREETGEDDDRPRFVARATRVFNVAQVLGWEPPAPERVSTVETNSRIEAFVVATGAVVRSGAQAACYRSKGDLIELPAPEMLTGTTTQTATEAYYAVLLHEIVHWTGAEHRLNRVFGTRFGDRAYAFEELVAELGSAFLCSTFGVANEPRPDHAAYIASWLKILDQDRKAVFAAASAAQRAVEYLGEIAASNCTAS
jgi:antirestriction protein ArdC